jgi:hypothetical protein
LLPPASVFSLALPSVYPKKRNKHELLGAFQSTARSGISCESKYWSCCNLPVQEQIWPWTSLLWRKVCNKIVVFISKQSACAVVKGKLHGLSCRQGFSGGKHGRAYSPGLAYSTGLANLVAFTCVKILYACQLGSSFEPYSLGYEAANHLVRL